MTTISGHILCISTWYLFPLIHTNPDFFIFQEGYYMYYCKNTPPPSDRYKIIIMRKKTRKLSIAADARGWGKWVLKYLVVW